MTSLAAARVRRRARGLGLPLLTKELIEQAVAPRTYVLRSLYAFFLFLFAILSFWERFTRIRSPIDLLGQGREMYFALANLQLIGILLFAPALTCGAITTEKERNTFGLLMLTRLGPWTILLEKYLGRLVTMGTFLLLSVPLLGFCYCFGGLDQLELGAGVLSLAVTIAQVAAIGMCCSAYCRTTVSAFLASYLATYLLLLAPIHLKQIVGWNLVLVPANAYVALVNEFIPQCFLGVKVLLTTIGFQTEDMDSWLDVEQIQMNHTSAAGLFFAPYYSIWQGVGAGSLPAWQSVAMCGPALLTSFGFLLLARFWLVRRAFAVPSRYMMRLFTGLDTLFFHMNRNWVTKGIVLINDSQTLPRDEPIAWRETSKKALGTVRYLVRVLLVMQFPTLLVCMSSVVFVAGNSSMVFRHQPAITLVTAVCWIMAVLFIAVKAATLVSGERSHETLDVLLSTPIRTEDFIGQKFQGVVRLMLVMAMPLMTAALSQTWYGTVTRGFFEVNPTFNVLPGVQSTYAMGGSIAIWGLLTGSLILWLRLRFQLDWQWIVTIAVLGTLSTVWLFMAGGLVWMRYSDDLWMGNDYYRRMTRVSAVYLLLATACVATYLPFVAWLSFYIGLRMRTQTRAIFASLAVIIAWSVLPVFLMILIWEVFGIQGNPGGSSLGFWLLFSPATVPFFLEVNELDDVLGPAVWTRSLVNFGLYLGLTLWFRHLAFRAASPILGRLESPPPPPGWKRPIDTAEK